MLRDVTERKRAERRIRYLARFDMLTKMPNRMQFQHLLHQAITRSLRQSRGLVLLYLDVDNFKEVNDTFGHAAGDRVLETLSERLARALPKESVIGRLAGDEFALFIETIDDRSERARAGERRSPGWSSHEVVAPAARGRARDRGHGERRRRALPATTPTTSST